MKLLHIKCTRTLTFENLAQGLPSLPTFSMPSFPAFPSFSAPGVSTPKEENPPKEEESPTKKEESPPEPVAPPTEPEAVPVVPVVPVNSQKSVQSGFIG